MARTSQTSAARARREAAEAARANPRRSSRQAKAKEPVPAPLTQAELANKAPTVSGSKKPAQAPRKRQRKGDSTPVEETLPADEDLTLARAKVAWAKTKGRRGHLKMVVEMPLELVLEIFSFLEPVDLLHLSMTTKSMRSVVMDKVSALPLWKAAFERVEPKPPACPEDLSLPQWANFLYSRTCFKCNTTQGSERVWEVLARLCKKCLLDEFSQASTYDDVPSDIVASKWLKRPGTGYSQTWYYRPHYEQQRAALKAIGDDVEKRKEYIQRERSKLRKRHDDLVRYSSGGLTWERTMKRAKVVDVVARRTNRVQAIKDKLEALGYKALLQRLGPRSWSTLPGFGGVKPLTDKEWSKLEPLLVDTLEELQKTFKGEDWKRMIAIRTSAMVWACLYYISFNRDREPFAPHLRSLALVEPFRTKIYDTPADITLEHKDFLEHLEEMPQIFDKWREEAEAVLLGLLPKSLPAGTGPKQSKKGKAKEVAPDRPVLLLATTLFSCKWCSNILTYPAVLSHGCLYRSAARNRATEKSSDAEPKDQLEEEGNMVDPNDPWNEGQNQVEFDEAASAYASAVIKALGEDPQTATWEELDRANRRVECLRCRKGNGLKRLVMDWRAAILHEFNRHGEDDDDTPDGKWDALDDESLAVAYEKEKSSKNNSHVRPISGTVRCCECQKMVLTDAGQVEHPRWSYSTPATGSTECPRGHDLTAEGATYNMAWSIPFKSTPHPVKIA